MKSLLTNFCFLIWATTALGQQQSETRSVEPFKGVKAAQGIDVYLKQGNKESVKLVVSGISLSSIATEVSGGYLKIHLNDGHYKSKNVKAYVTYVEIEKLSASSAASIFSEGIVKSKELSISASSAGSVEITIEATSVHISASSAGEVDLKGKATTLTADAASAGEIDTYDVDAEKVVAEASSGASVKINATKELEAHASSAGSIRYRGNPTKAITNSSSGGSVKKSD